MKAIQRGIRMMHLILLHDRIRGEHTVADSDIQMTSGLHSLWTRCLSLKSFLAPFDTFAYLLKINLKFFFRSYKQFEIFF